MVEFYNKNFREQKLMRTVILSLIPIIIFSTFLYGWRILFLVLLTTFAGTAAEYYWEKHYKNKASEAVFVSCILYTLTLPPSTPFYIAVLGILFGVLFGKLFFGGFGRNVFNPALVGRAFIYVNFPEPLTMSWNSISTSFSGGLLTYLTSGIDAISGATPLILFNRTGELYSLPSLFLGTIPGSIGEGSKILIILAAAYMIYKKAASWEIMAGSLLGFLSVGSVFYFFTDVKVTNPLYGLLMGGFVFGSVFMATDPISAAKTVQGKWIYGFIIGAVTVLIRSLSLFTCGVMFSILIGNTFAPIIDYFVKETTSKKKSKKEVTS